jgi:hypothetical protein
MSHGKPGYPLPRLLCVNNKPGKVSQETRQRVQAVAQQLG